MPRSENQKQKIYRLLHIMMSETDEEHGLSINDIIERLSEFGIRAERKSIYDDFLTLEELGYSVARLATRPPKYYLEDRVFELAELKMLVDAVQASKFITAAKSRELISKLEGFAGIYHSRELSRQVYVEDRVKTGNTATIYSVDAIHSAINENKKLSFKYFYYDSGKRKVYRNNGAPYTVSPCGLVLNDENYYLVALDENTDLIKNFRVDKMQSAQVINDARKDDTRVTKFNPADYSKRIFGMYGGKEELVTFECRESLAGVMIDRFGAEASFQKTEFGFKLSVRLIISPNFFAWVLGFGEDIRVLSPDSIRSEFAEKLNKTLQNYVN